MTQNVITNAYQELVEYLARKASPQELLDFRLSEAEQEHARDLLERASEGGLTADETAELEQMRYFDQIVSSLKARALTQLDQL